MVKNFRNLTALVTGASSGIGLAITRRLLKQQTRVIAVGRRKENLEAIRDDQNSRYLKTVAADLSDEAGMQKLLEVIGSNQSEESVDILVNNAGAGFIGEFGAAEWSTYSRMIQLNVAAVTRLTHYVVDQMKDQGRGGILNISSMAGWTPVPGFAVYAATRTYITSFSIALHQELKSRGIHVTAVHPGPTRTNFYEAAGVDEVRGSKYMLDPDFVAGAALEGLIKNKMRVLPGLRSKLLFAANSISPFKISVPVSGRAIYKRTKKLKNER